MAITAGSVTVASNATHTGSGYALALYEGKVATRVAIWAAMGFSPTTEQRAGAYSTFALEANEEAARVVPLINAALPPP